MMKTVTSAALALTLAASAAHAQSPVAATHPNGEVALVVDFEVKTGFEEEFERYFARSTTCSRLEPGNVAFNVHKVVGAPGRYVLYEIWRSPAALESHFQRPYTIALFQMFDRALVRPVSEGGLRYIGELAPARRSAPVAGDPSRLTECQ
jgi:quinol monooxygenase YgiN